MLFFTIIQLFSTVLYTWLFIWILGYHGVFATILINLFINFYISNWELYLNWLNDYNYIIIPAVWLEFGNAATIYFEFHGNTLTFLLLVIMSSGASIVVIFTYVEMWNDKEGANFIILLLLFIAFMLILVSSGNLFIFFIGWEGIGIVSLFLISFWTERVRSFKATFKVYIINKIGDILLLLGILITFLYCGSTNFILINNLLPFWTSTFFYIFDVHFNSLNFITFLFILASGVKSAQFGFHIWLLDAMEAPLGASALMHSSTLVIAGIILLLKLQNFILCSTINQTFITIWGSWTALFAIIIACFQYELKIILAYTTISSMGIIYFFIGINQNLLALNYLVVHAYTKIFFFLTVGLLILNCNGCQDIRWMGQLLHNNTDIFLLINLNLLNLLGLPFTSGYFAKHTLLNMLFNCSTIFHYYYIFTFISYILAYYILIIKIYLGLFLSIKNGHRSIYRQRANNLLVVIILFSSNYILFFNTTILNSIIELKPYLYSFNNWDLNNLNLFFNNLNSWLITIVVFSFTLIFLFIINLIHCNKNFRALFSQYWCFCFFGLLLFYLLII